MTEKVQKKVSNSIWRHIKELGLNNFPCGIGSWNDPAQLKVSQDKKRFICILSETDDPQLERCQDLLELISSAKSPWYLEQNWSREASSLRQAAVTCPALVNQDFIQNFIRTLHLVDTGITEVDTGLLKFKKLEELTLSANYITNISSKCLPLSLKVLELYANNISDVNDLCSSPPPLQHLGLGKNLISSAGACLSGSNWPHLLSLDLSHNNLSDLPDLIHTLTSLPKLRNLTLQGNPFMCVPAYRGYIIDKLKSLSTLDDIPITAEERLAVKGFAELEEMSLSEAFVQFFIMSIKGLKCPPEILQADKLPDYPVVERLYFVELNLPQPCQRPTKDTNTAVACQTLEETAEMAYSENLPSFVNETLNEQDTGELGRNLQEENLSPVQSNKTIDSIPKDLEHVSQGKVRLVQVVCPPCPWQPELAINWTKTLHQCDLVALRDFFRDGMNINIVEQKIESYPVNPDTSSQPAGLNKRESKDIKKSKQEHEKGKDKGKKKKEVVEELIKGPPSFSNVASFHVPLDMLLDGQSELNFTLVKPHDCSVTTVQSKPSIDRMSLDKQDAMKDKKEAVTRSPPAKKEVKKRGQDKGAAGREKVLAPEVVAPSHIELELRLKLIQWSNTLEVDSGLDHDDPSVQILVPMTTSMSSAIVI